MSYTIYLHKLLRRSKTSHTKGHQYPTPSMAAFGWVLSQLLADLTVDFIPTIRMNNLNLIKKRNYLTLISINKHKHINWLNHWCASGFHLALPNFWMLHLAAEMSLSFSLADHKKYSHKQKRYNSQMKNRVVRNKSEHLREQSSVIRSFRNVWICLHGHSTRPDTDSKKHDPVQPALYNITIKIMKQDLCKAADDIKLVWIAQEKLKEDRMERMACSCLCFDF